MGGGGGGQREKKARAKGMEGKKSKQDAWLSRTLIGRYDCKIRRMETA